jgi:hypothetical protein
MGLGAPPVPTSIIVIKQLLEQNRVERNVPAERADWIARCQEVVDLLQTEAVTPAAMPTEQPTVVQFLKNLEGILNIQQQRAGMNVSDPSRNMIFVGNAGVGMRDTVNCVAQLLHSYNINRGHVVAVTPAQFLIQDLNQIEATVKSADHGVLYIANVAAFLTSGTEQSRSLLQLLLDEIERPERHITTILACKAREVVMLAREIPALHSRFPFLLDFPDLDTDAKAALAASLIDRWGYTISAPLRGRLAQLIDSNATQIDARESNAYLVHGLVSKAIIAQSQRLSQRASNTSQQLIELLPVDFGLGETDAEPETAEEILVELRPIIGLKDVKEYLYALYAQYSLREEKQRVGITTGQNHAKHMLFLGNPGTGKTTIALIMAKLLKRLGLLKHGQLIEAKRADLVAPYLGQTAQRTTDVIHSAMGGVLFIDEAYSLCYGNEDIFGLEALTTLLEMMEANRDDLVVILAGYPQSMEELLSRNPGLRSRFPTTLNFPDYFPDELADIACQNVPLASHLRRLSETASS